MKNRKISLRELETYDIYLRKILSDSVIPLILFCSLTLTNLFYINKQVYDNSLKYFRNGSLIYQDTLENEENWTIGKKPLAGLALRIIRTSIYPGIKLAEYEFQRGDKQ